MAKSIIFSLFLVSIFSKQLLDGDSKPLEFSNACDLYEIPLNYQLASLNLSINTQNISSTLTIIFTDLQNINPNSNEYCGKDAIFCQKVEISGNTSNNNNTNVSSIIFHVDVPIDKIFIIFKYPQPPNESSIQIQLSLFYPPKNIIWYDGKFNTFFFKKMGNEFFLKILMIVRILMLMNARFPLAGNRKFAVWLFANFRKPLKTSGKKLVSAWKTKV